MVLKIGRRIDQEMLKSPQVKEIGRNWIFDEKALN